MRLHETEVPLVDRGWRHVHVAEVICIAGNTVTIRTTLPNLKERTDTLPLSDVTGLKIGTFLDWESVAANGMRVLGVTPPDALQKYREDLATWKRKAGQDNG